MQKGQVDAAAKKADQNPGDVVAQLQAAYACDKFGDEERALHYYEIALSLNVPKVDEKKVLICYASTLNNIGRCGDAIMHLTKASQEYPESAEVWTFLSLALRKAGNFDEAYKALLKATVIEAGAAGLGGFSRAVSEYLAEIETQDN